MDREDITERIEIGARLAREAYPGPWRYDSDERKIVGKSGPGWYDRIADNGQTDDTGEFIAHWNPEFALELVREVERLRLVEEAARNFLMNAESKQTFLGNDWCELLAAVVPEAEWLGPEHAQEHLLPRWRDAALANPAAE